MSGRQIINCAKIAPAVGPYSHAVRVNNTIYLSGQIGMNAKGELASTVVDQANQAMKNIGGILESQNATYENIVKCTILLRNMSDYGAVNDVYKSFFKDKFPARLCYAAAGLPKDALIEIDVIASLELMASL